MHEWKKYLVSTFYETKWDFFDSLESFIAQTNP